MIFCCNQCFVLIFQWHWRSWRQLPWWNEENCSNFPNYENTQNFQIGKTHHWSSNIRVHTEKQVFFSNFAPFLNSQLKFLFQLQRAWPTYACRDNGNADIFWTRLRVRKEWRKYSVHFYATGISKVLLNSVFPNFLKYYDFRPYTGQSLQWPRSGMVIYIPQLGLAN